MSSFLRRHWFALVVAGGMIAFQLVMTAILLFAQPAGQRWVGSTLVAPADNAVYLAEIRQGSFLIKNPYAVEPHAGRFDLIWSPLAIIHGVTQIDPLILFEIARWAATIFLAFMLVNAARSVADNEETAQVATLLMVGGIGLGWVQAIFLATTHRWIPGVLAAPDLLRPIAVAPTLLSSPHVILSFALLVFTIHGIWKSVHDRTRATWSVIAATVALTFFHPFFIPLLLVITVMAWTKKLGRRPAHERTHKPALTFFLCLLPATAYYLWFLMNDSVFSGLRLVENAIPFPTVWGVLFAIGPGVAAVICLLIRHDREQRFLAVSRWCLAWLIGAVTLFALPVLWRGILIEALMIPLVLLGLPVWMSWYKRIPKQFALAARILIVAVAPITLLASQVTWLRMPLTSPLFSQSSAVFHAWDTIKQKQDVIVVADDLTVGTWTPAWSGATSWIGHPSETPSYTLKRSDWADLFSTQNGPLARRILAHAGATHILITSPERAEKLASLLGDRWAPIFEESNVVLLEKR
jgi:hypothetical protein